MKTAEQYAVEAWSEVHVVGEETEATKRIATMFREYGEDVAVRQREACAERVQELSEAFLSFGPATALRNGVRITRLVGAP